MEVTSTIGSLPDRRQEGHQLSGLSIFRHAAVDESGDFSLVPYFEVTREE
ncbi:MAG: hypothetical protein RIG77_06870 [Cyclobacteriaceae bacterium]